VIGAAKEITTAKYPDSDQATVDQKMVRVYRPDGSGEELPWVYVPVTTTNPERVESLFAPSIQPRQG
jgi:hypothetical protein